MMKIDHRPILTQDSIQTIEKQKSAVYVCTTELKAENVPVDIFYGDVEHPVSKSRYFGIYHDYMRDGWFIIDGSYVEELDFGLIKDDDTYYYSRYRHDYFTIRNKMIDGGRAYVRSGNHPVYAGKVVDGVLTIADAV